MHGNVVKESERKEGLMHMDRAKEWQILVDKTTVWDRLRRWWRKVDSNNQCQRLVPKEASCPTSTQDRQ